MLRYIKALFGVYDFKWQYTPCLVTPQPRVMHRMGGDFHIGSDYCDNPKLLPMVLEWIAKLKPTDIIQKRMFLNGDIVDLKCCPPLMVDTLIRLNEGLHTLFGPNYVDDGNHGAIRYDGVTLPYLIITSPSGMRYAMTHGDLLIDVLRRDTKKKNYWRSYRDRENGIEGFAKLKVKLLDSMDFVKAKRPLPEGYIELCSEFAASLNVNGIIVSHFHVEDTRWYTYLGREHVFLPAHRFTEVYL